LSTRAPGPKEYDRYETVGPNYEKWGEQEGYMYDPATDTYRQVQTPASPESADSSLGKIPGLLSLAKHGTQALAGSGAATSSVPAGYAVAADGMTLINPATGAYQIGTGPGGAALMADGSVIGGTGGAAPGGGLLSLKGIGTSGNALLPLAGAAGMANLLSVDRLNKDAKGWVRGGLQGAASGAAMGSYFGPPGALVGGILGGLIGLGKVGFGHKSTKDYQSERWGNVIKNSKNPNGMMAAAPAWMRGQEDDHIFDDGPHKGQKWSWDLVKSDILKGGENTYGANGFLGNYETFGDEWDNYPMDKKAEMMRRFAEEDIYKPDKGDVIIFSEDQDRAKQIRDEVLGIKKEEHREGPAPLSSPMVS